MYTPFVRISTGNVQTTLDAVAKNVLGAIYSPPPASSATFSTTSGAGTSGYGAQPVYKYVYFNAVTAPTAQIAPAPVYWADETFTIVTSHTADNTLAAGITGAGYWMPNTTALGTSNTAAQWGTQFQGSYGWIQIGGLLPGALAPTTGNAVGDYIYGSAGDWTSTAATTIGASSRVIGIQWTAIAATLCDVLVGGLTSFWGS